MTAPFDPAAWLTDFERDGGFCAMAPDGRLWLFTVDVDARLAFQTGQVAGHPDRVEAIKGVVRERCLIA